MRIKVAIIGCGRIGNRHAQIVEKIGEVVAVCDTDTEKADLLATKLNVRAFYSLNELLSCQMEFDLLSVCTPNGMHAVHTIEGLNSGYHVLCEKPMALNSEDCQSMIEAAKSNEKKLFIVKQNRYNPPVIELKKLLDNKQLGRILSFQLNCFWNRNASYYESEWKGSRSLDGGILYTQFSHFVDLVSWMFGEPTKVFQINGNISKRKDIEFEDTLVAACSYDEGFIGTMNFTINAFQKNMEGSLTVFGEKGTVKIGGQYLNELEYQSILNTKKIKIKNGNPANNYGEYSGSMSNHEEVYKNVIDVLSNNGKIGTNGKDGLNTVRLIEKLYSR